MNHVFNGGKQFCLNLMISRDIEVVTSEAVRQLYLREIRFLVKQNITQLNRHVLANFFLSFKNFRNFSREIAVKQSRSTVVFSRFFIFEVLKNRHVTF